MAKTDLMITNFTAGELSQRLKGRVDLAKYFNGCEMLENMLIYPHGGAVRRPGTVYTADVKDHTKKVRLIPFEFSTTQAYVLEFGHEYMRVYKDNGQVESGGSPYEISTPYQESELFELKYVQSADTMYIVHPNYQPRKLTRTGHTSWTLTVIDFEIPPLEEVGITPDTTCTPGATTGTGITFTFGSSVMLDGDVGRIIRSGDGRALITTYVSGTNVTCDIIDNFESTDPIASGNWDLFGAPDEEVTPSAKEPLGTLTELETDSLNVFRSSCVGKYIRINEGVIKVTSFVDATKIKGKILITLDSEDASTTWTLEDDVVWTVEKGYPSCVAFFEERLVFAGTESYPQTIWASKSGLFENINMGTLDDDGFAYSIAADQVNAIRWLSPQNYLLAGTSGGEWRVGSETSGEPLSPTNIVCKRQSTYGSKNLQGLLVNDVVLFVQRTGKKIREFTFSWEKDGYVAPDKTLLAEHITGSGIVQMAYQQQPDSILWCVREDGVLIGMTYERSQEVMAWHRHITDGEVESIAVIPASTHDEVWLAVKRTINGTTRRYIEYLPSAETASKQRDCFYVDSGLTYDGGEAKGITNATKANPVVVTAPSHGFSNGDEVRIKEVQGMTELNYEVFTVANTTTDTFQLSGIDGTGYGTYISGGIAEKVVNSVSGLDHLEGKEVQILADGAVVDSKTVSSGSITLDEYANTIHAGLAYASKVQPMPISIEETGATSQGRTKRISDVVIRFYKTIGAKVGYDEDNLDTVPFRSTHDEMDEPAEFFTGDKNITFPYGHDTEAKIIVVQDLPLPMTVLAIIPRIEFYER